MGRHSVAETVPDPRPTTGPGSVGLSAAVPAPRRSVTGPLPVRPLPPGFHAPPAGLDAPLPPPAPWPAGPWSARSTLLTYLGAGAGALALVAAGGATLGALADAAGAAVAVPTVASEHCSDVVAATLDATVEDLVATPSSTWDATVSAQQSTLASQYGVGSVEYASYTDGVSEIVAWLTDPATTETYENVVDRVVPSVIAACDTAHAAPA